MELLVILNKTEEKDKKMYNAYYINILYAGYHPAVKKRLNPNPLLKRQNPTPLILSDVIKILSAGVIKLKTDYVIQFSTSAKWHLGAYDF